MAQEMGQIQIHSENIFPIIKRWLYSDRDIFIRELVSNGIDAITKLRRIASMGEVDLPEDEALEIHVAVDAEHGTLSFSDNGIGMTGEEVRKYLTQVAFSSAEDFLKHYKGTDEGSQIIGHFGLGFYSAFMVAKSVTVETLSWQSGAEAVLWKCDGDIDYTMEPSQRTQRGTTVTLVMDDDSADLLSVAKIREELVKYCSFLPYPIYLEDRNAHQEEDKKDKTPLPEDHDADACQDETCACHQEHVPAAPAPINDTHPLWMKKPSDCTEEEYRAFYHRVFTDFQEPLFWVHLNADYPIRLQGILYFPRISNQMQTIEGKIKLYNNQVYVADNVQEVIPEYLMMLKGVIDCPDLPLNVSRSALQTDREVQKIPAYIARKVADRLISMDKTDRESYEKYWNDIRPFILYGCLRDEKFYERMQEHLIFGLAGGGFTNLTDYLAKAEETHKNTVYYTSDPQAQAGYLETFARHDLQVLVMDSPLDIPFVQFLESKHEGVTFARVDAVLPPQAKSDAEVNAEDGLLLEKAFRRATGREHLRVRMEALADADTAAVIQLNEQMRRWQEMGMFSTHDRKMAAEMLDRQLELVLNAASPVVQKLAAAEKKEEGSADSLCCQVFDLARLGAGLMNPDDLMAFVHRSQEMLAGQVERME